MVLKDALWALKGKYVADTRSHTHAYVQDQQTIISFTETRANIRTHTHKLRLHIS